MLNLSVNGPCSWVYLYKSSKDSLPLSQFLSMMNPSKG